jgi:Ca2+-binding EF-hand superfamily protein
MEPLAYRGMDFEEFCAAAISSYQLEALDRWEDIAGTSFQHFEKEGNRVISVEELAQVSLGSHSNLTEHLPQLRLVRVILLRAELRT